MRLPGFTYKSNLIGPDEALDALPTCVASILEYLTLKPFSAASVREAICQKQHETQQSEESCYREYCREQQVKLWSIRDEDTTLMQTIRAEIAQGHPIVAIEKEELMDAWNNSVVFHACEPATITAMNAFGGHPVTADDATWSVLLAHSIVWGFARMHVQRPATIQPPRRKELRESYLFLVPPVEQEDRPHAAQ